jgi:hypothetical protein
MIEVLHDVFRLLAESAQRSKMQLDTQELLEASKKILDASLNVRRAPAVFKRALGKLTAVTKDHAFVFLDDFHLVDHETQPVLLHLLHGALKGPVRMHFWSISKQSRDFLATCSLM